MWLAGFGRVIATWVRGRGACSLARWGVARMIRGRDDRGGGLC